MNKKERTVQIFGRIASVLYVLMYVSYISQIMNNLAGDKGNPIQPVVAMVNCIFWVIYASMQKKKITRASSQMFQVYF